MFEFEYCRGASERFPPHPGFKFPACSYSGPGDRRGLTCLQFCSDRAAFVSIEIFSRVNWWFGDIFPHIFSLFFVVVALVCILQCCLFAFEFCDFG